jgi:hypothetical protein
MAGCQVIGVWAQVFDDPRGYQHAALGIRVLYTAGLYVLLTPREQ